MRHRAKIVKSVPMLIKYLKKDIPPNEKHVWFRGQSKKIWPLVPTLGRRRNRSPEVENYLIKRFRQNATQLITSVHNNSFQWLLTMQHHGVPTRLLDWSENALIGLYFGVTDNPRTDGSLWVLLPSVLNKNSNIDPAYSVDIPSFEDPIVENYSVESLVREGSSHLDPIAVIVPRTNPRIQAQLGVFTLIHRDPTAIEDVGDKQHVWKYSIPHEFKKEIRKELELLGINKFSLFPELSSIGELINKEI